MIISVTNYNIFLTLPLGCPTFNIPVPTPNESPKKQRQQQQQQQPPQQQQQGQQQGPMI